MIKSNYRIKTEFVVLGRVFWGSKAEKPGFLVIELLIAILIGLVLISALMRMQSTLCELSQTFYMRERALGVAVNFHEQIFTSKKDQKLFWDNIKDRVFSFNIIDETDRKIKVKWQSIKGRECVLEL